MDLYASYYGDWNDFHQSYTWQSLGKAGKQCGISLPNTHRAKDDANLARTVLNFIAGNKDISAFEDHPDKTREKPETVFTVATEREPIQVTIDAADSGKVLRIKEDIGLTTPISITKSIVILGNLGELSEIKSLNRNQLLNIESRHIVKIESIKFTGPLGLTDAGIKIKDSDVTFGRCIFNNLKIDDTPTENLERALGIFISGNSSTVMFTDCEFINCDKIFKIDGNLSIIIDNCKIINSSLELKVGAQATKLNLTIDYDWMGYFLEEIKD